MSGGIAGLHYLEPGVDGLIQTFENTVFYGDARFWNFFKLQQSLIAGTSRDAGNTPDTELRAGLPMAFNQTTRKWVPWVEGDLGGIGLEKVNGLLFASIQTQRNGADQDRYVCAIAFGGLWRAEGIILPGEASRGLVGATNEAAFRTALAADMPWVRLSDQHEQ